MSGADVVRLFFTRQGLQSGEAFFLKRGPLSLKTRRGCYPVCVCEGEFVQQRAYVEVCMNERRERERAAKMV